MGIGKKIIAGVVIYTACRIAGCVYDGVNHYSKEKIEENIGQTANYVGDRIKEWGDSIANSEKENNEQKPSRLENELEPEIPISEAIDIE